MTTYYDELRALLAKNNRHFKATNAGSSYWSMLKAGYNEDLAFKSASLLDKLQVSATEMWIDSYFLSLYTIDEVEVDFFISKLPEGIDNFHYYSDELTSFLINLYKEVQVKSFEERGILENHLYRSLSKELFTYRRGHQLVQKEMNKD